MFYLSNLNHPWFDNSGRAALDLFNRCMPYLFQAVMSTMNINHLRRADKNWTVPQVNFR